MSWTCKVYPKGSGFLAFGEWRDAGTPAEDPPDFTYSEASTTGNGGAAQTFKRHAVAAKDQWNAERTLDATKSTALTNLMNQ